MGDLSAHCFWADEDKSQYTRHLELGASSGDPFAMYCHAYEQLKHVKDGEEAQSWIDLLKKAAEKGESYACMHLGQIYRNGYHGCYKDADVSNYWFKKSISLGNETACAAFGRLLLDFDEENALIYLKRGAMLGDAFAQSVLGYQMTWNGKPQRSNKRGCTGSGKQRSKGTVLQ